MTSKKHRKKCENRGFGPPKPLPKPSQNPIKIEVPKNMQFFIDFGSNFDACCKSQHQKNVRPRSVLLAFHTFPQIAFGMPLAPKNLLKTLPKRGPNPSKIDAKNVLFSNIDFFGFRPRFGRLLGLQLGAKLAILASKL